MKNHPLNFRRFFILILLGGHTDSQSLLENTEKGRGDKDLSQNKQKYYSQLKNINTLKLKFTKVKLQYCNRKGGPLIFTSYSY